MQLKNPIEYIKEAVKIYIKKENFLYFAKVMSVLVLASTLLGLLSGYLYPVNVFENLDFSNLLYTGGFILISLVAIVLGVYTKSVTLETVVGNENLKVKPTFIKGWKKTLKYLIATFLVSASVGLGVILLIIPGIIFGVWFSFTLFLVFDKGLTAINAMKQSKVMVKGRFWKILGRLAAFIAVGLVVSIVLSYLPYAGTILVNFLAPLYILPSYLLYKDIVSTASTAVGRGN